ncbi:hypothetical protein DAI22_01g276466 [Oryza sativa Japonica Group]|nr:hypothetical protein DAI22_01g276466 [Oryza sativa Japonica Group]
MNHTARSAAGSGVPIPPTFPTFAQRKAKVRNRTRHVTLARSCSRRRAQQAKPRTLQLAPTAPPRRDRDRDLSRSSGPAPHATPPRRARDDRSIAHGAHHRSPIRRHDRESERERKRHERCGYGHDPGRPVTPRARGCIAPSRARARGTAKLTATHMRPRHSGTGLGTTTALETWRLLYASGPSLCSRAPAVNGAGRRESVYSMAKVGRGTSTAQHKARAPASLSGHLPRALLRPAVLAPARAPRPPRRAPSQSLAAALGIGDEGRHRWDTAAALPTAVPPSIYPLCRPVAALVQEAHQSYWKGSSRLGQQRLRLEWLDGEEKLRVDDNGSIYSKSCHVCTRMVLWTS